MKKIFILTGEPSGDKLASTVIAKLQQNHSDIEYLSVGGSHLNKLGVKSIYDLKEITYIGFTSVILNLFKIKNKINKTVKEIIEFNPDILFSVDSPDFTLRVAEKVKKLNNKIKTVHYVAPQVWVWRESRIKKFKKFLDHILLLFDFEKKYFDKEDIPNTFVGHPLLENEAKNKIDLSNIISDDKKIISLFCGSRSSEVNLLLPILIDFINIMNEKFNNFIFVFHATDENRNSINDKLKNSNLSNIEIISDKNIKSEVLLNSIFAVSKSGTVSLEICNAKVPSIIIYKINFINYLIMKLLVKVKFANILNILSNQMIIQEVVNRNLNKKNLLEAFDILLNNQNFRDKQILEIRKYLPEIQSKTNPYDICENRIIEIISTTT